MWRQPYCKEFHGDVWIASCQLLHNVRGSQILIKCGGTHEALKQWSFKLLNKLSERWEEMVYFSGFRNLGSPRKLSTIETLTGPY
jgi:hypothetical protein